MGVQGSQDVTRLGSEERQSHIKQHIQDNMSALSHTIHMFCTGICGVGIVSLYGLVRWCARGMTQASSPGARGCGPAIFSLWDSALSSVEWGKWCLLFLLHRKGREQLLWSLFSVWGPVLDMSPYRSHYTLSTIPRSWNHSYFHKSDGCSKSWSNVSRLTATKKQSHSQNSSLTAVYAFYSCLR